MTKQREVLIPVKAPKPIGPYSVGIRSGDWLFTSGMIGIDPDTGSMIEGDITAETRQVMDNLGNILKAGGSSLASVLKTTVYITDLGNFNEMNQAYAEFFSSDPPARSTVQVAGLPGGARVMIEMVAVIGEAYGD